MPAYLARAGADGMVKIGYAKNVAVRIFGLQGGCPIPLIVIREVEGPRAVEAWLHRRFAEQRRFREWFDFHPDMLTVQIPQPSEKQKRALIVREAVQSSGGRDLLARKLGIAPNAITQWKQIPADRLLAVSKASGIPLARLRPDLYHEHPQWTEKAPALQEVSHATGGMSEWMKKALVLAVASLALAACDDPDPVRDVRQAQTALAALALTDAEIRGPGKCFAERGIRFTAHLINGKPVTGVVCTARGGAYVRFD